MSLTIGQIKKVMRENSSAWSAHNRVTSLAASEPEGTLGNLIWEGIRTGQLDVGEEQYFWSDLREVSKPFSGQDMIAFFKMVATHHPDGPYRHGPLMAGWTYEFETLFEQAISFDGVSEVLAKQWNTLPAPYCDALAYALAKRKVIDTDELPEHLLSDYARLLLEELEGHYGEHFAEVPWSDEVWRGELIKIALSERTTRIKSWDVIEFLASSATPAQIIGAFAKLCLSTNERFPQVAYFRDNAKTYMKPFEDYISSLDASTLPVGEYEKPAPLMHLSLGYLACCQALGEAPKALAYPLFEAFYHGYKVGWSGGSFEEYFRTLNGYLGHIPSDVAEPMLLGAPKFQWLLTPSVPTQAVFEAVAEQFRQPVPSDQYNYESHANTCLALLGDVMVPHAAKALVKNKRPMRSHLISFLGEHPESETAVKALCLALKDSSKGNRETAQRGLLEAPTELVLDHLGDNLNAGAKVAREMAARTLDLLTASDRGHEMAQARLASEKVQAIKDILARVQPGVVQETRSDSAEARIKEATASILESDGKSWSKFEALGDLLIPAYMEAWKGDAGSGTVSCYFYDDSDYTSLAMAWIEVLEHLGAEHEAGFQAALQVATAVSDYSYGKYFDRLNTLYGADRVGAELVDLVVNDRFVRPSHFEPCRDHDPRKEIIPFILEHYSQSVGPLLPSLLEDKRKTPRTKALSYIRKHPEAVKTADIEALLSHKSKDVRETAAEVMGLIGDTTHITKLKELKEAESARAAMLAMERAIGFIASRSVSLEDYPSSKAGQKKLDAVLGALDHIPPHRVLTHDVQNLPIPTWLITEEPMSQAAFEWMLAEIITESFTHRSKLLVGVCRRLKPASVHELCEELIEKCAGGKIHGWSLFAQSTIAGESRLYKTGALLEEFAKSQNFGWGDHGVIVFERVNSPLAVRILDDWSRKSRRDALKWRAAAAVARMARAKGVSVDDLTEMAIPDFDFDARGERRFDYGGRTICVRLGSGDALEYIDETSGKSLKTMPNANSRDDAELVKQARAEVSLIKKELKRLRRVQQTRFQNAMISNRRWKLESWRERYAFNPVMRSFAQGVLWGIFDDTSQQLGQAVIVDASGDLIDLEDEIVKIDESTSHLGVVHPCMLSEQDRKAWMENFAEYELIESFPQLTRDVHVKDDWPENVSELCARFKGLNPLTFMGRADRLGWEKGAREDAGLVSVTNCRMGDYHVQLGHDSYSPDYVDDSQTLYVNGIHIQDSHGERVAMSDVPGHIFSEIIYSLMHITGGLEEQS